jgi:hypothetical protein
VERELEFLLQEFGVDSLGPEARIDQHVYCDNCNHGNSHAVTEFLSHHFRMMESLQESEQEVDAQLVEGLQTVLKGGVERMRVNQIYKENET